MKSKQPALGAARGNLKVQIASVRVPPWFPRVFDDQSTESVDHMRTAFRGHATSPKVYPQNFDALEIPTHKYYPQIDPQKNAGSRGILWDGLEHPARSPKPVLPMKRTKKSRLWDGLGLSGKGVLAERASALSKSNAIHDCAITC